MSTETNAIQAIWSRGAGGIEIHRSDCPALNKATDKPLSTWIKVDALAVEELAERGYEVKHCKCVTGRKSI